MAHAAAVAMNETVDELNHHVVHVGFTQWMCRFGQLLEELHIQRSGGLGAEVTGTQMLASHWTLRSR